MTKNELKVLRMNLLGGMNDYICNEIGDEDYWEWWIAEGVPDGATEDDLESIAEDEELFADCCKLFGKIVELEYKERVDN